MATHLPQYYYCGWGLRPDRDPTDPTTACGYLSYDGQQAHMRQHFLAMLADGLFARLALSHPLAFPSWWWPRPNRQGDCAPAWRQTVVRTRPGHASDLCLRQNSGTSGVTIAFFQGRLPFVGELPFYYYNELGSWFLFLEHITGGGYYRRPYELSTTAFLQAYNPTAPPFRAGPRGLAQPLIAAASTQDRDALEPQGNVTVSIPESFV